MVCLATVKKNIQSNEHIAMLFIYRGSTSGTALM